MPRPIVTLTTDFGTADHYAAVLKGVIRRIAPNADILDLSHDLAPYEIVEAAFFVGQSYTWFPKKTIHVIVVDPGVGSARRPLLMEAAGQFFVAPDNGVLTMVAEREKHKARAITADRYFLKPVSATFHGRDIFAPCAAHLAKGVPAARFGKPVADHLRLSIAKPARTARRVWTGAILKIDRFGNLLTNFSIAEFEALRTHRFEITVGMQRIGRWAANYAGEAPGELFVIAGSSGYLEISANQASAAKITGCASGAPLELTVW